VDAPPATIGDPADFLHVEVDHVPGPASGDLAGLAAVLAAWVDEPALAEAEAGEVAGDGAAVDREPEGSEFVGDALCGPLVVATPGLGLLADPCGRRLRTPVPRPGTALPLGSA